MCYISFMILDAQRINIHGSVCYSSIQLVSKHSYCRYEQVLCFHYPSEPFHLAFFMFLYSGAPFILSGLGGENINKLEIRKKIAKKLRDTFYLIIFISNVHINVVQYI